jgi:alpha-mannosidase
MKRFVITVLCGLLLAAASAANAAAPVRIYLANDDHTDFMWTADAETYAKVFVEMLDFHLQLADETATNAPPYRNRFNADGNYWLWTYEQMKTPAEFARLIGRLKDGTLSAPLNALVSCYGGQPAEAVLRGMYYAGRLERQHDLRLRLAVAMENQTLPLGLASLFAGSGARYSWRGVCGYASRFDNRVLGERPHEIYWWTGHDDQRLLLKWHSLAPAGNQHSGGYAEAFNPVAAVQFLDSDAGFLSRYRALGASEPYRVRAAFGFGWDALDRKTGQPYLADPKKYPLTDHFHRIAQTLSTPERKVIVSNEQDFFEDFETTHGPSLNSVAVTYGNEWDLYSASMSETSARVKRAVENLRSAELLASLVSLKYPPFMTDHQAARDRAFLALGLYWEHNWTADGPISRSQRAAWQEQRVGEIESFVNALYGEGIRRLGGLIQRPAEANRFFVLNPLGWPRTDAADFAYPGPADIHVRDLTTGRDVPHQLLSLNGSPHLRILASDVPPAGYKVFEIISGQGAAPTNEAATVHGDDGSIFENDALRLVLERDGAIRSFTDKQRGNTELAATLGGLKLNDFAADTDEGEPLRVEHRGPVSVTLLARSQAGLPHTTAITLYRGSDRVDIRNELHANFDDVRHWAFSFALNQPSLRTEEVGAVILNQLQSAGGDYADTHARYDYLTVNHFADITDGSGTKGITVSNPDLAFARLGHSTASHLDTTTPQLHLLAGGQVDGPKLGIRGQNGNTHFLQRFALRPHGGYHPVAAMKFALEHQNPFVTGAIHGSGSGAYPETTHSLLKVSNPDVLLWALKPHEDGIERGLVARLWNLSDQPAGADITLAGGISVAHRMTHIETDIAAVPLTAAGALPATFNRQQIQTYRLDTR